MLSIKCNLNFDKEDPELILELSGHIYNAKNLFNQTFKIINKNHIVKIDFKKVDAIEGNFYHYLYYFPKLKEITMPMYYSPRYHLEHLELFYNKNIIINNRIHLYLEDIVNFYKKHQDDPYYNHDMIKSGLFDNKPDYSIKKMFYNDVCVCIDDLYKVILKSKNGIKLEYIVNGFF